MRFDVNGTFRPHDLEPVFRSLAKLLVNEQVDELTCLAISFLGWRSGERTQIVDPRGFVTSIVINGESLSRVAESDSTICLPEGITIRDRPHELDDTPLAIWAGHDD